MHSSRTRRQRRRREGAVMVEGLIVTPALITIALCSKLMYERIAADLDGLYIARAQAWTSTIDGCEIAHPWGEAQLADSIASSVDSEGSDMEEEDEDDDASLGTKLGSLLTSVLGTERTVAEPAYTFAPARESGPLTRQRVPVNDVLMGCNERPHDLGTRRSSIQWVSELFGKWSNR